MRFSLSLLAFVIGLVAGLPIHAEESKGWRESVLDELDETWRLGTMEYSATFRTVHMPWAYSDAQNKDYQNWPPGFGLGHGYFDTKGNWHGIFAMGFQDSHSKPEWAVGYGWKTYWQLPGELKFGLGYSAGITTRTDIGHYAPVPYLLPIASIDYGKLSVEGVYVPGGKGNGNVMLIWAKWHTESKNLFEWN